MVRLSNLFLTPFPFIVAATAATVSVIIPQTNTDISVTTTMSTASTERFRAKLDRDRTVAQLETFSCVHGRRPTRQYTSICECLEKWSGSFCDRPACVHGELDEFEKFCSCRYGWTGVHCDTPACGANGTAKIVAPDSNIYICECDKGFSGDRCENRSLGKQSDNEQRYNEGLSPVYLLIIAICALLLIIFGYCRTSHKLDKYCRRRHGDDNDDRMSASERGSREGLAQVNLHPLLASPFARVRIASDSSSDLPPSYYDATQSCFEDRPPSYSADIVALYLEEKDHANV